MSTDALFFKPSFTAKAPAVSSVAYLPNEDAWLDEPLDIVKTVNRIEPFTAMGEVGAPSKRSESAAATHVHELTTDEHPTSTAAAKSPAMPVTNSKPAHSNIHDDEVVAALRAEGVSERHIAIAQRREALTRESLTTIMSSAEYGFLTPEGVARVNARLANLTYYTPDKAERVPAADIQTFLAKHKIKLTKFQGVMPVDVDGEKLVLAIAESKDRNLASNLFPGVSHVYVVASQRTLQTVWRRNFANSAEDVMRLYHELVDARVDDDNAQTLLRRFVISILRHACYMGASDIGFTPSASLSGGDVRLKVDGQGQIFTFLPKAVWDKVQMHLLTQTGSQDKIGHGPVDKRFEWLAGDHEEFGEISSRYAFRMILIQRSEAQPNHLMVVLRILDQQADTSELDQLGFDKATLNYLRQVNHMDTGLMLVTGPTGSGKTTTLYALLNEMDPVQRWVQSIENPIEYQRGLWMQLQTMQVASEGADSAEAKSAAILLKGLLRAAPNVILFGEVRKSDIALELIDAANTGHLAFTTFHVTSAALAISRLKGFGLDMAVVASLLRGILAQRLVRTLCTHCAEPDERISTMDALNNLDYIDAFTCRPMRPVGCPNCNFSGFRGRRMVYELLQMTPAVRTLIEEDAPPSRIAEVGIKPDNTIYANALKLVAKGLVSIEHARALSDFVVV